MLFVDVLLLVLLLFHGAHSYFIFIHNTHAHTHTRKEKTLDQKSIVHATMCDVNGVYLMQWVLRLRKIKISDGSADGDKDATTANAQMVISARQRESRENAKRGYRKRKWSEENKRKENMKFEFIQDFCLLIFSVFLSLCFFFVRRVASYRIAFFPFHLVTFKLKHFSGISDLILFYFLFFATRY